MAAWKGEGDEEHAEIGVFDELGWKMGVVCLHGADTLRVCLDLRLEAVEGQGVDGFNFRNSRSSFALTLARREDYFENVG